MFFFPGTGLFFLEPDTASVSVWRLNTLRLHGDDAGSLYDVAIKSICCIYNDQKGEGMCFRYAEYIRILLSGRYGKRLNNGLEPCHYANTILGGSLVSYLQCKRPRATSSLLVPISCCLKNSIFVILGLVLRIFLEVQLAFFFLFR